MPLLRTYPSLKVWVAGCSAGEEVYSLAILLREEGLLERTLIYATDINPQRAGAGARPASTTIDADRRLHREPPPVRRRVARSPTTTRPPTAAVFDKSLREHIVFSDHSLATDSVFAEVQLVSCRNVLIYFDRELQDRAIGLFRDSLCRKGFLGLGAKESLRFSAHAASFDELVPRERIYQKRARARDRARPLARHRSRRS